MFKASLKLAKINKGMHVSFNVIVHSDDTTDNKLKRDVISRFRFNGNDYMNIQPTPYVTIDISSRASKKMEGYNPNRSVNLNGFNLFITIKALRRLINRFHTVKELYYYDEDELVVNKDLSKQFIEIISTNDKTIRIQPVVVPPDEVENSGAHAYEGCVFIINSFDSFVYLTITELEYLLYTLSNIRMGDLSLSVINTVKLNSDKVSEDLDKPDVEEVEIPDEQHESRVFVKREDPHMLPNI